jgi:hypothetical protein
MVPSPSRPRFSQADLDSLSVIDDAPESKLKSELRRSDSYGDMQMLAIKRHKEFPDEEAVSKVAEKRKLAPTIKLGLTQRELDQLCMANDSEGPQGEQNPNEQEEEEDSVYVRKKREKANLEGHRLAPDLRRCLGYSQSELDRLAEHDEADQSNDPEPQSSPHGSALTAIKRAKLYKREDLEPMAGSLRSSETLEPMALAPQLELVQSGIPQPQLDLFTAHDEADQSNASDPCSPHGSALTAIKRARLYNPEALEPMVLAPMMEPVETKGPNQAELDALCVDAEDDDDEEDPGSPGSLTKKDELEEEQQTWSPWNSPRRSTASSPAGDRGGHRSPSPGHGGA